VTSIQSHIDMENTLLSFGNSTGQYEGFSGSEDEEDMEHGHFVATSANPTMLWSVDQYTISGANGDETHFQYILDFACNLTSGVVGSPLGSNSDPVYGCLLVGPFFEADAFNFILTNTKVYAMIQQDMNLWAVPIKNRHSVDVNLYTIVVNRSQRRVLFRIDNKTLLDIPGFCGIDSKFNIGVQVAKACSPAYTEDSFMSTALNRIYIGPLAYMGMLTKGFCQGGLYNMCNDNISFAPSCVCQYSTAIPGNVTLEYTANVRSIDIFTMGTTNRCDLESSSSSYHNWWSRPGKADEEHSEQA
jgi:hypothetical protein